MDSLTIEQIVNTTGEHMQTCPVCSPHRTKKKAKCLGTKREEGVVIYHCFHCGIKGKIQVGGNYEVERIYKTKEAKIRTRSRARTQRVRERRSDVGRNTIS